MESAIALEKRLARVSDRSLQFSSPPTSLQDTPSPPSLRDADSRHVSSFRASLEAKLHTLRSLPPMGHRDVDRRRWRLIEKTREELEFIATVEELAWKREKVKAGLYGHLEDAQGHGVRVFNTGE